MRENIRNQTEKGLFENKVARIQERTRSLRERIFSRDEADAYLEDALNELVLLVEEVLSLSGVQGADQRTHKRDTEDELFKQLGLPPVESLLAEMTEKYGRAISGNIPDEVHHMRELDTKNVPMVPSKFLIKQFIFNGIRPRLIEWVGVQAADRLLKTGVMDTWLQLLFYRNPIAIEKASFFVLKKKDVISFSIDKGDEVRQSFALHRERLNLAGPHVSVAYMPSGYEQPYHTQKRIPEHNLLVQGDQELRWIDAEGNTRVCLGEHGDVFFVPALVAHTIRNSGKSIGINLMVKPFFERREFIEEQGAGHVGSVDSPKVLNGKRVRYEWGDSVSHTITSIDGFSYEVEITDLSPGRNLSLGRIRGGVPYEQEVVVSFAHGLLIVERDSSPALVLKSGSILYAGADYNYRIRNTGSDTATFVRIRVLNSKKSTHSKSTDA